MRPNGFDVGYGAGGWFVATYEQIRKASFVLDGKSLKFQPVDDGPLLSVPVPGEVLDTFADLATIPVLTVSEGSGEVLAIEVAPILFVM